MAGCSRGDAGGRPTAASTSGQATDATPGAAPAGAPALDAAPEAFEPIRPEDVLFAEAAERVIASGEADRDPAASPPAEPPIAEEGRPALLVTPTGVGPFRLDLPRVEVVRLLGTGATLRRGPAPPGAPSTEWATLRGPKRTPLLRLRVLAGRLAEVQVVAPDEAAATEAGIHVGDTFEAAMLAHGEPRRTTDRAGRPLGWVLSDLPGVIFAPAGPVGEAPLPAQRIARIIVVGPEGD